jgi:hypothetical protein
MLPTWCMPPTWDSKGAGSPRGRVGFASCRQHGIPKGRGAPAGELASHLVANMGFQRVFNPLVGRRAVPYISWTYKSKACLAPIADRRLIRIESPHQSRLKSRASFPRGGSQELRPFNLYLLALCVNQPFLSRSGDRFVALLLAMTRNSGMGGTS